MHQPKNEDTSLSVPEKSTVSKDRRNWTSSRLGKVTAGAVLALEFNPLSNEALRFAALGATLGVTHDPVLAATAFGASTLAIEGAGGIVTADVLDTPAASNLVDKSNKVLNKLGASRIPKMNKPTEAAIAIVAGTPTVTFLKHRESPERTRQENRRYATIVSLGISAVTAAQGFVIAEGIHAPSPETISLAALGVGSFLASWKWARSRLNKSSEAPNNSSPELSKSILEDTVIGNTEGGKEPSTSSDTAENYFQEVSKYTVGPQIEGLTERELSQAEQDPSFIKIPTNAGDLPFLAPIKFASWLNPAFFAQRGYESRNLRYCLLPQELLRKDVAPEQLIKTIKEASSDHGLDILIDYPETIMPFYHLLPMSHRVDQLITDNGTPAATYHYHSRLRGLKDKLQEYSPDPAIKDIDPTLVEAQSDRIWDIYESGFQALVNDHPIAGAMSKEELLATLKSPSCLGAAYFDERGLLQSFGYAVTDLDLCPWLNKAFIEKEANGSPYVYMPGVVSSPNALIASSTKIMTHLLQRQFEKTPEFMLNFECSNKSAEYIPKLVRRAFDRSGFVEDDGLHELKHFYGVVSFPAESVANTSSENQPVAT